MKFLGYEITRRSSPENESIPVSASNFLAFFGQPSAGAASVSIDEALEVPTCLAAVAFLSRTLASLPKHVYRKKGEDAERVVGGLQTLIHEAPNPEWPAFSFWAYFWQQVFTGGRGLAWIERSGSNIVALWPMDPTKVTVRMKGGSKTYQFAGKEPYPAADVIDIPFMLKADQVTAYGPIAKGARAIRLALDMTEYGRGFFNGGGIPPLALVGPMPAGPEAMQRAMAQVQQAIDVARASGKPVFQLPPGYELKPIGFEPEKGQMTDGQRFQVEQLARLWQLPPVFVQDLTRGTFSNTEQQDLHLVKHLVAQWAQAAEDEMNLKLFGQRNGGRYIEHNLDGLLRGDFKTRADAVAALVQCGVYTPNIGAKYMGQEPHSDANADKLYMQGAMVPLGSTPVDTNGGADDAGTTGADDAA